jgi:hypothetical protein
MSDWEPTDKQIEAARDAFHVSAGVERFVVCVKRMLIAAREAEPPPSVEGFDELLGIYDGWLTAEAPEWMITSRRNTIRQDLRDLFVKAAAR